MLLLQLLHRVLYFQIWPCSLLPIMAPIRLYGSLQCFQRDARHYLYHLSLPLDLRELSQYSQQGRLLHQKLWRSLLVTGLWSQQRRNIL